MINSDGIIIIICVRRAAYEANARPTSTTTKTIRLVVIIRSVWERKKKFFYLFFFQNTYYTDTRAYGAPHVRARCRISGQTAV